MVLTNNLEAGEGGTGEHAAAQFRYLPDVFRLVSATTGATVIIRTDAVFQADSWKNTLFNFVLQG